MSRMLRNILGLGMFSLLSFASLSAAESEWTRVYYDDFGDGDSDFGTALPFDVVNESYSSADDAKDFVDNYMDLEILKSNSYTIFKHTNNVNNWYMGGDHTYKDDPNKGYFLAVNPGTKNKKVYSHELKGICQGVTFRFSTYFANMQSSDAEGFDPNLSIGIYKDKDATELVSPSAFKSLLLPKCSGNDPNSFDWEKLELEFEMNGTQDYAYFIVAAVSPETNGFDFAVDDILLEVKHPKVTVTHVEEDYEYEKPAHLKATFDNEGFFANMASVKYQWSFCKEGSTEFVTVGTSNPYTIASFDKNQHNGIYRVQIAENGDFNSKVCALQQDFPIHETMNKQKVHLCEGEVKVVNGTTLDASQLTDGVPVTYGNYTYDISIMHPKPVAGVDDRACIGVPVASLNGKVFDKDTTMAMNDTIKSKVYGCDSIIVYKNLVVTGPTTVEKTEVAQICQGKQYLGVTYSDAGLTTVTTTEECIEFKQKLMVNATYDLTIDTTICEGEEIDGTVYSVPGTKVVRFEKKTVGCGCDSIVTMTIHVTSKIEAVLPNDTICFGETYTFANRTYSEPGDYDLIETTTSKVVSCDSITKLHLKILPEFTNKSNPIDTIICCDSKLFGEVYSTPTEDSAPISKIVKYTSKKGCDSTVYYNVHVLKLQLALAVKADRNTVCRGEEIEIKVTDLRPANTPLDWPVGLNGSSQGTIFTPEKDMICVVKAARTLPSGETCHTEDSVFVYVRDSPILTIDSVDQRENLVTYNVQGGVAPVSVMLDGKEVSTDASGELKDSYIGVHTLTAVDANQCSSEQHYSIVPIPIYPSGYLSPNGDGVNDRWTIENIDLYGHARVRIYDRNGRLIVEYYGYDNDQGWDGRYNGHLLPATDYWYEINLPEVDDQYVGHFTLLYMQ